MYVILNNGKIISISLLPCVCLCVCVYVCVYACVCVCVCVCFYNTKSDLPTELKAADAKRGLITLHLKPKIHWPCPALMMMMLDFSSALISLVRYSMVERGQVEMQCSKLLFAPEM